MTLTNGMLTMNPVSISYTIHNDSHAYGSTADLAGDLPATFDTGINGENLSITYSSVGNTATAHVGTYNINGSVSNGTGLASDYTISLTNGTMTVDPAILTITANSDSKTYGTLKTFSPTAFTYTIQVNYNDQPITIPVTGTETDLLNSDTIDGVTETSTFGVIGVGVGRHLQNRSIATGTGLGNYAISYVNSQLTVDPATLTITANSASKTYGTSMTFSPTAYTYTIQVNYNDQPITIPVTGTETDLLNSDTIDGVTETSTGALASESVGIYRIDSGVTTGLASPSFPYFAVEPLVFLRHVEVPEGIPLAIEVGGS